MHSKFKQAPNYITPEGLKNLQQEFKDLFHGERPKLVETVAWAAGNGDRSENGDYIYGKKRLRQIDSRLKFLRDRIESSQVIDPQKIQLDTVSFGAVVRLKDEDGVIKSYQIVGEDEFDPKIQRISWKAPIAKSLLGKRPGDELVIQRPAGELIVEILDICRPPSE